MTALLPTIPRPVSLEGRVGAVMVAGFEIQEVADVAVEDVGGQDVVGGVVQGCIAAKCSRGHK